MLWTSLYVWMGGAILTAFILFAPDVHNKTDTESKTEHWCKTIGLIVWWPAALVIASLLGPFYMLRSRKQVKWKPAQTRLEILDELEMHATRMRQILAPHWVPPKAYSATRTCFDSLCDAPAACVSKGDVCSRSRSNYKKVMA